MGLLIAVELNGFCVQHARATPQDVVFIRTYKEVSLKLRRVTLTFSRMFFPRGAISTFLFFKTATRFIRSDFGSDSTRLRIFNATSAACSNTFRRKSRFKRRYARRMDGRTRSFIHAAFINETYGWIGSHKRTRDTWRDTSARRKGRKDVAKRERQSDEREELLRGVPRTARYANGR
jgi:hypothetical protein